MNKRAFLLAALAAVLTATGCTTTSPGRSDPDARRRSIDAGVDDSLRELYKQAGGSEQLVRSAKGVLVFPSVLSAAFIVGASTGDGALRKSGKTTGYFRQSGGSVGFQAGAQSRAVFVLFMTDDALAKFEKSSGWTVGVDAGVTLVTVGANAQINTNTAQQPVVGFVLSNSGLMGGVSLDGARITRLSL